VIKSFFGLFLALSLLVLLLEVIIERRIKGQLAQGPAGPCRLGEGDLDFLTPGAKNEFLL
jgi:hypothetical protein